MTEEIRKLSRRRIASDGITTVIGVIAIAVFVFLGKREALLLGSYSLLLGTSTAVVTFALTQFTGITIEKTERTRGESRRNEDGTTDGRSETWQILTGEALESDADIKEDTGWLIGRLENVLVLTLVIVGEYTALSIIFAAKSWVRVEDTAGEDSTYYLAGTLVNFTYSIVIGIGVVRILGSI